MKSSHISIGALARSVGLRASAVRYYEERGLLPAPRRCGGRRQYDSDALLRLRALARARALGFGVAELSALVNTDAPARRAAAAAKAAALRIAARSLLDQARALEALEACTCADLAGCALAR